MAAAPPLRAVRPRGRPARVGGSRWSWSRLLALNLWISSQALQTPAPIRIPYSPTFLAQVRAGNVKEIASTPGGAIQGTLKTALRYPANDKTVAPSTNFATQVPSFANNYQLESMLQNGGVTIDAKAPNGGTSFIESLIFGFGPTLLLFLIIFVDHAARGRLWGRRRPDVVRAFAGAAGRRCRPAHHLRGCGRDRRGQGGADRNRRLPQDARQVPGSSAPGSRAAYCCRAPRAPARRCWRGPWPARPAFPSSRCQPPSSWR